MAATRYSRQRELIYQALQSTKEHPTADMIYQALKPENPSLSLGTVYRNLNLLASEGRIVRIPSSVDHYDGDTSPHSSSCSPACAPSVFRRRANTRRAAAYRALWADFQLYCTNLDGLNCLISTISFFLFPANCGILPHRKEVPIHVWYFRCVPQKA